MKDSAIKPLDPQALMAEASQATGLKDTGDERAVEALSRWLEAAADTGRLTPMGVEFVKGNVNRLLVNRLRFEDDVRQHPEILDEDVSDPIVIIGLLRTGTTKLQRMLSDLPGTQGLWFWRLMNLAPFPEAPAEGPDPRIAVAREFVAQFQMVSPEFLLGHPIGAEEADEEAFVMEMTFETPLWVSRAHVPAYAEWWMDQPRHHPYRYLHRQLQYLQWQDGGKRGRPLVLKSPAHLGNLDILLETFPQAVVVHCHRDPVTSIPSMLRLVETFRSMHSDQADPADAVAVMLPWMAGEMRRNLEQRDRLGSKLPILDVNFREIVENPLAVIGQVHRLTRKTLSPEAEKSLANWDERHPHRATHTYSLEQFGLTETQIRDEFAEYLERFPCS